MAEIGSPTLTYGREVRSDLAFDVAIARAIELLKGEGFGVLCDIDVSATMKAKLGESFRPYRILDACNPQLAHRTITAEPQIGLLLPCNVVVQEIDGVTVVSAVNARAMLGFVGNASLSGVADEVGKRLDRVLDAIQSGAV